MSAVETVQAYLARKYEELELLNSCLRKPLSFPIPRSVGEVIERKFEFTALLRAEHELENWKSTETAWAHESSAIGPFAFNYDYQRADLNVRGPSFYELGGQFTHETIYSASGMAAISALLFACARVIGQAQILIPRGSYSETRELIEGHLRDLQMVMQQNGPLGTAARADSAQILLLDSCTSARAYEEALRCTGAKPDLLIFDTTCFSGGSGRIRRVLAWARRRDVPIVLVRSHAKLDSLGAEYGRLGSAAFVQPATGLPWAAGSALKDLPSETRNAIRLFGGAALPAHFPPYIGTGVYRSLTNRRVAAILRNSRRASRYFDSALKGLTAELHFTHGLYITLRGARPLDDKAARQTAAKMSEELGEAGLPLRHAGSFGFDFAATEWCRDSTTDEYCVRIAVPDLPTPLWDELTDAVVQWWRANRPDSVAA
jgi:hypothetical protein